MITLEATKQVADDSPDHICPVGAVRDNFTSQGLIDEVKDGFDDEQISVLDLGCAGAQFVVDFINVMPGFTKSKVKSRIILTPQHAKRLTKALQENVKRFEQAHGEIKDYEQPPMPLNFGPTGQA